MLTRLPVNPDFLRSGRGESGIIVWFRQEPLIDDKELPLVVLIHKGREKIEPDRKEMTEIPLLYMINSLQESSTSILQLMPYGVQILWVTLVLSYLCLGPGYILQRVFNLPRGLASAFLLSMLFNTLTGFLLSSTHLLTSFPVLLIYIGSLIPALLYARKDRFFLSRRVNFQKYFNRADFWVFLGITLVFMLIPRWQWTHTMEGLWPGDPIDRMARVQLLLNGFNIWEDVIPGQFTWYPPIWTLLIAIAHYLTRLELYTIISSSALLWGLLAFTILYVLGNRLIGKWGGNILILFTVLLVFQLYVDLCGIATPQGFSYLLVFATAYCLMLATEEPKALLLAALGSALALMTYPHAGYYALGMVLMFYALLLLKNETRQQFPYLLQGLLLIFMIAAIYWIPFTVKYGVKPPADSWLRNIYKVATEIHSKREFLRFVVLPYSIDFLILFLGWLYWFRKRPENFGWKVAVIYVIYLSNFILLWHHLVTQPLLGFSIQPDRFHRYAAFSRGIVFTWGILTAMQVLRDWQGWEKLSLGDFIKTKLLSPLTAVIILLVLATLVPPCNRYFKFEGQILRLPDFQGRIDPVSDPYRDPEGFLMEYGLLAMSTHPKHYPWELDMAHWIQKNTSPQAVILAPPWHSWYHFTGLAGRRVYVNLPPYHGPMDDSQAKRWEIARWLYYTPDPEIVRQILVNTQVDYVAKVGNSLDNQPFGILFDTPFLQKVYTSNGDITLYQVNKQAITLKEEAPIFPADNPHP